MTNIDQALLANPFFGLMLTLGCYVLGQWAYKKTGWGILQSILACSVLIIVILKFLGISFEEYQAQNQVLTYILPITVVALAVPLYNNLKTLKKYWLPVLVGIVTGTTVTMATLIIIAKAIGTDYNLIISMIPKSATNAIAIQISDIIGGVPSLTVVLVVITGTFGGTFGPELLTLLGVKNKIARGIAIGSITHAVGTARAFREDEVTGTMSSLALAITGTLTAVLAPIFVRIFL